MIVIHAVPMLYVQFIIIKPSAHVCQIISDDHQIVDQNVSWMKIAQQHWLVCVTNAKILVMEHVGLMLIVLFSITGHIVFATVVLPAIHLPAVVKSFYVRASSFLLVGFVLNIVFIHIFCCTF